jgi:hypothetical protein
MTLKQLTLPVATLLLTLAVQVTDSHAQGMPIDSLRARLTSELRMPDALEQLRAQVGNYENMRVWGMAIGDFSNDAKPDLAISLYDIKGGVAQRFVSVRLFQNIDGKLVPMMTRSAQYFESPIEVGLSIDNSAVSIIQKTGENSWFQEGYTIQFGDVILTERFDTESQTVQAVKGQQPRNFGRQISRNYENLMTREMYFGGATGETLLSAEYYTIPAYNRLRSVYPGYGSWMMDTSTKFMLEGIGLRRNWMDLSIAKSVAAYDDEYLYVSMSVNDDYLSGGNNNLQSNDRIVLWLDTYLKGERVVKSRKGGTLTFRDALDSFIYSVTIPLTSLPGRIENITYTSVAPLNSAQLESAKLIRAQYDHDTTTGDRLTGYTMRVRIPWGFLGFESNPVSLYETRAPQVAGLLESTEKEESPIFGFTALVHDIDDPNRPGEVTVQATSTFRAGDPSSFGALDLKPSTQFYGRVYSTFLPDLKQGLLEAGF